MESYSRFSVALPVETTALSQSVIAFETLWMSPFWPSFAVQGDLAFLHPAFTTFLDDYNTLFRPIPPARHYKNLLDPKHGVIRSVYLRLKSAAPDLFPSLFALSAVRISDELYGSNILSSFEIAKGYSKPIYHSFLLQYTPGKLVNVSNGLKTKRKLTACFVLTPAVIALLTG